MFTYLNHYNLTDIFQSIIFIEDSSPEESDVDSAENTFNEYVEESYYTYVSQYTLYNLVKVPFFVKSKRAF